MEHESNLPQAEEYKELTLYVKSLIENIKNLQSLLMTVIEKNCQLRMDLSIAQMKLMQYEQKPMGTL